MKLEPRDILIRDVENKKMFYSKYDTQCSHCGGFIAEGEPLYFFGNTEKTCDTCYEEILEYLRYGS